MSKNEPLTTVDDYFNLEIAKGFVEDKLDLKAFYQVPRTDEGALLELIESLVTIINQQDRQIRACISSTRR